VSELPARAISAAGFAVMLAIAFLVSSDRSRIPWRTVAWGVALQLTLGILLLRTPIGDLFFRGMNLVVAGLTAYTDVGVRFVFGALVDTGFSFFVNVLPIIVFMGSLFAVLYHVGLLQKVVDVLAVVLSRTMGTSGAESLAAGANLFVGMTESALIVRPYLERMTRSELFSLMTLGMATVAGSVMLAYVAMLGSSYAGHLATASLLSLPAGLLVAKMMVPETDTPETAAGAGARVERTAVNLVDAAAQGAIAGLRLAGYVGALLLAFVALVAMVNDGLATLGGVVGLPDLTLQWLLGVLFAPLAWVMGVPWQDATTVGSLLGVKTVLNEFLAYQELSQLIEAGALAPRSALIASYALCGFANLGSLAILFGGLGGLAPSRRGDIARFGLRSIVSGTLASFMTACVAGMLC
jgi:CNT family concentrative nucleoside transporter